MVGAWAAADTDDTPRSQLSHAIKKRKGFCGVVAPCATSNSTADCPSPSLRLAICRPSPRLAICRPQKHTASLVFILTAVTRRVPKHPLMLQLGGGKKHFRLFYPQWCQFLLPLFADGDNSQKTTVDDPV